MKFKLYLTNATCNISPDTVYNVGETVNISVVANSGFYFESVPYVEVYNSSTGNYDSTPMNPVESSGNITAYQLTYTIIGWDEIYANAVVIPKMDKYGIIQIFNPTPEELKAIGEVRYQASGESGGIIDLGGFITNLSKVFVNLPNDGTRGNVVLGGYDTNVEANYLFDDVIETDCGTIEIKGKYNNIMDYKNTTVEIYLPFIGFKELDTDKVMNEVLNLIYKTNIINGDSLACIYNTSGTLIYTFNCNLSFEIPYKMNADYDERSNLKVDSNYLFGFTPFVTIRTNKEYNTAAVAANDNRVATIGELSGYITCSQVFNTIKATTAEKEAIDNLLKSGIILSEVDTTS